jgi:hypothetical protein
VIDPIRRPSGGRALRALLDPVRSEQASIDFAEVAAHKTRKSDRRRLSLTINTV